MTTAPFTNILVATDFGPASLHACNMACDIASQLDARLTLLHVWTVPLYPYGEHAMTEITESGAVAAMTTEAERVRVAHPNLRVRTLLIPGLPWCTIIDAIAEHKFDLVVLGTHGRQGAIERLMLGSVAEKVVRASPVPVLTAHA